jgi:hypothetical protein
MVYKVAENYNELWADYFEVAWSCSRK